MKKYFSIFVLFIFIVSCSENKTTAKKPLLLGDSSLIVTEKDSQFLQNFTVDISPSSKKTTEEAVTKMMVQVDSLKTTQKIEQQTNTNQTLNGFTINFNECTVVFENLLAHAINSTQDERNAKSVSYVIDRGDILEMNLSIKGINVTSVEQRITTKLSIENSDKSYVLNDLNKFISPWYNLVGKNSLFISVGTNSLQFNSIDNAKIKNAYDRVLRKDKKSNSEINTLLKQVENVKSYSDAPCKVNIVSTQYRIKGDLNGKHVQKLIQFDYVK